jgi:polyhydroxyalkanoate synthesis repressor PhaR
LQQVLQNKKIEHYRGSTCMTATVTIKKYANRRLYDTEKSIYVTLAEVAQMIRKGRRVLVVDAKTNEDVTAFTLTQIILEEAKNSNTLLPPELLHIIIQYGDNLLSEFFGEYLQKIVANYLSMKSNFEAQYKQWIDLGMRLSDPTKQASGQMPPFHSFFSQFYGTGQKDDEGKG